MLHPDSKVLDVLADLALIDQTLIFREDKFNRIFQRQNVFSVNAVDVVQHRANRCLEAAQLATKQWVRVAANLSLGAYDVFEATGDFPEPEWPNISFKELLQIAFRDTYIQSLDHPVIRRLRGEL